MSLPTFVAETGVHQADSSYVLFSDRDGVTDRVCTAVASRGSLPSLGPHAVTAPARAATRHSLGTHKAINTRNKPIIREDSAHI